MICRLWQPCKDVTLQRGLKNKKCGVMTQLPPPHLLFCCQVPFAYCWSEALVPKPADWGDHIDVVGYCFLNEGSHMKYQPPQALEDFLEAGKPPVYIGFGSLMVDDAKKLTRIILEAAQKTDQRVLLSR